MACEAFKKWTVEMETQEVSHKPVFGLRGLWERNGKCLKTYMKDETGDTLALLIVMFYLSTLSLHNKIKFKQFKRR